MAEIDEHLAYHRDFRAQVLGDLQEYQSGRRHTSEHKDGAMKDTTASTISELKRQLAKIDQIVAGWEAKKNA
jgi:hypothetical protein